MRAAGLVLLLVPLAGCFGPPEMESSTRICQVQQPTERGVALAISEPELFAGYCVQLRGDFQRVLGKVPADGVVWFPLEHAGRYSAEVTVQQPGDPYCAEGRRAVFDYNGTGLLHVDMRRSTTCY